MKNNLFLILLVIYFSLLHCKTDPELEKLKSILSKDRFQYKNFSPIDSKPHNERIGQLPEKILKNIIQSDSEFYTQVDYSNYTLNMVEKNVFLDAINRLPEKYKQVLDKKLIGYYFIKNYNGGGSANWLIDENNNIYYFVILNPELFSKTSTEWEMYKNENIFCSEPNRKIIYSFDKKLAIYYLLIHETSHIIDMEYRITPYISLLMKNFLLKIKKEAVVESNEFTNGMWRDFFHLQNLEPELDRTFNFYNNTKDNQCINPIEFHETFFKFLGSNLPTFYSTRNWTEDFAELSSIYLMNKNFQTQYKIKIIENGKTSFEYNPLENEIIQSRIKLIQKYFE